MKMRFFLIAAATVLTAAAQETRSATRLTNDHYFDFERVSDAQISPDGAHIVYIRQQANKIEDRWESSIWIVNADGSQNRFLAKGSGPRWSSDAKRVLYIAEGEPRGPQIFVRWIDAEGPATQITHATDKVADARWSPDGKWIAFSMFVPEKDNWNISMPAAPQGAQVDRRAAHRGNAALPPGSGRFPARRAHASVRGFRRWRRAPGRLPMTNGARAPGELRARVPMDWTPDSKAIVFEADRSSGSRSALSNLANCWWRMLRRARFGNWWPRPAPGAGRRFRPMARQSPSPVTRNRSTRTRWRIFT